MKRLFSVIFLSMLLAGSLDARSTYYVYRQKYSPKIYRGNVVDLSYFNRFAFTFSNSLPDDGKFDLNMGRSFGFSMDMISADVALNSSGTFCFHSAINWTFDNYVSDKDLFYYNDGDAIISRPIADCKKSKVRADYLGIPVGFAIRSHYFRIYANVIGEMLTNSKTKYKTYGSGKHKEKIRGLEQLGASVEGGIKYDVIGVFVKYRFTDTFRQSSNLDGRNILSAGFTIDL